MLKLVKTFLFISIWTRKIMQMEFGNVLKVIVCIFFSGPLWRCSTHFVGVIHKFLSEIFFCVQMSKRFSFLITNWSPERKQFLQFSKLSIYVHSCLWEKCINLSCSLENFKRCSRKQKNYQQTLFFFRVWRDIEL